MNMLNKEITPIIIEAVKHCYTIWASNGWNDKGVLKNMINHEVLTKIDRLGYSNYRVNRGYKNLIYQNNNLYRFKNGSKNKKTKNILTGRVNNIKNGKIKENFLGISYDYSTYDFIYTLKKYHLGEVENIYLYNFSEEVCEMIYNAKENFLPREDKFNLDNSIKAKSRFKLKEDFKPLNNENTKGQKNGKKTK